MILQFIHYLIIITLYINLDLLGREVVWDSLLKNVGTFTL